MALVLVAMPGNAAMAERLAALLGAEIAAAEFRAFPDGESYVRIASPIAGRTVAIVATLDRPDAKFLPLVFTAATVRDLGAARVGLIAPYLAYLRQDRRFKPGEALTSASFAKLLSCSIDWLVTVDPHLHRISSLSDVYSVPARSLHAAPYLARWIEAHVETPLLVGPDAESVQWVSDVAMRANAPYTVLEKLRRGDSDVDVSLPSVGQWRDRTPVLVDDIISTARTMIETLKHLRDAGAKPAVCIGVHAVFAERAFEALHDAGARAIVTTNTIAHSTNGIDVSPLLADAVRDMAGTD